jgi:hypothetical protein
VRLLWEQEVQGSNPCTPTNQRKSIMEYKVINATYDEFHKQVAILISEGWVPQGGVSVIREYLTIPTTYYFQAFIKNG